jgi:hypothetical protein
LVVGEYDVRDVDHYYFGGIRSLELEGATVDQDAATYELVHDCESASSEGRTDDVGGWGRGG